MLPRLPQIIAVQETWFVKNLIQLYNIDDRKTLTNNSLSKLDNLFCCYGRNPCIVVGDANIDNLDVISFFEELIIVLAIVECKISDHNLISIKIGIKSKVRLFYDHNGVKNYIQANLPIIIPTDDPTKGGVIKVIINYDNKVSEKVYIHIKDKSK
ncbi:hypothetical protein FF38_08838 [Lucilia cuprina]|uniref:Endonuclease/exonuclease/phosphatase domain-containing protein n=1 Tax=Lucilia cuprina TaxID=7375 RepID=A0A0L0CFL0_LUCCU|nr:hypothetical protein FF38_08838 [Lucilia cuprina]